MGINMNNQVKEYISSVCSEIKNREIHEEIKLELENHIEEIAEDYLLQGITEDEAIDRAISQMGDAGIVGRQLNKIHKPRPEWGILVLALLFAGTGLLSMYFIESSGALFNSQGVIFKKTLFFNLVGIGGATLLYFFDYRKIQPFSKHIYIGTLLVLILTLFNGGVINGMKYWTLGPLRINVADISPFLFAFSLAGIFDKWDWKNTKNIIVGLFLLLIPIILMFAYPSLSSAAVYSAVFIVLMAASGVKLRYVLSIVFSGICMFLFLILTGPAYRFQRFFAFINPGKDPLGSGYVNMQIYKLIHSTGLLGHGMTFKRGLLPEAHTDFIFTYIIYTFGWLAGITLMALFITFILRITSMAKTVKNNYGRLLSVSFAAIFAVQILWNVLMTLGLAPLAGVGLPFISYGGSQFLLNMCAIGIISSIYRRKNVHENFVKSI